jgi:hypothetical protein
MAELTATRAQRERTALLLVAILAKAAGLVALPALLRRAVPALRVNLLVMLYTLTKRPVEPGGMAEGVMTLVIVHTAPTPREALALFGTLILEELIFITLQMGELGSALRQVPVLAAVERAEEQIAKGTVI